MAKSNVVTLHPAEAGAKGGKMRAQRLSPEERKAIAAAAARARWEAAETVKLRPFRKPNIEGRWGLEM